MFNKAQQSYSLTMCIHGADLEFKCYSFDLALRKKEKFMTIYVLVFNIYPYFIQNKKAEYLELSPWFPQAVSSLLAILVCHGHNLQTTIFF